MMLIFFNLFASPCIKPIGSFLLSQQQKLVAASAGRGLDSELGPRTLFTHLSQTLLLLKNKIQYHLEQLSFS